MDDCIGNRLCTFAFGSRLVLIVIQFLSNVLIPDHDAKVFNPPVTREDLTLLDRLVEIILGGLKRWDAIYFVHISEHGYTYENCAAFFPFFPMLVMVCAKCLSYIGIFQFHIFILLVAVSLNCILFALTAKSFYILSCRMGFGRKQSFLSSILFCFNPASIFMTAPYSEVLYIFLLVQSLLYLQKNNVYIASFFISLSIFTRSNGLVGIGFVLHNILISSYVSVSSILKSKREKFPFPELASIAFQSISKIFTNVAICVFPFFLYQYYIYLKFCHPASSNFNVPSHILSYGRQMKYKLLGDPPSPWCNNTPPLSYSYIQFTHWGVGFFKYYELRQIPNFLLAFPVIYYSLKACWYCFNQNRGIFYGLGIVDVFQWRKKPKLDDAYEDDPFEETKFGPHTVVFVYHLAFLTLFGCIFMHIQVLTRMLFSSSPLIYWYCAIILSKNKVISAKLQDIQISLANSSSVRMPASTPTGIGTQTAKGTVLNVDASPWISGIKQRQSLHSVPDTDPDIPLEKWHHSLRLHLLCFIYKNWSAFEVCCHNIIIYFGLYFVIGTIMFSNFLPWT